MMRMDWRRTLAAAILVATSTASHTAVQLSLHFVAAETADCGCAASCRCRGAGGCCTCSSSGPSLTTGCSCGDRTQGHEAGARGWETILNSAPRVHGAQEGRRLRSTRPHLQSWLLPCELLHPA